MNCSLQISKVVAELVELARKIKEEGERGKETGLTQEEIAFYDALCANESAIRELGDETLKQIARELVVLLRQNTTVDWTIKESVQAKLRIYVKKLLRKYNYPPDKQESATQTVLEQAKLLCEG
ncbi:MAG: DUF3387 domain-containing protein [Patescibacteria group bacterium]|nr:DUF3387 domain-containing protein [Patescibacteria group bacterium]